MPGRVLIVEDEPDLQELMALLLATYGFETTLARNGREALEQMRRQRPCVVVLDLMMPIMDGFQFCEERQKDAQLADVPVLAFSAAFEPAVIQETLGVRCFRKSDSYDGLIAEIQTICGSVKGSRP